jgi:integrase
MPPDNGTSVPDLSGAQHARAQKVWGLPVNPAAGIERYRQRSSGDIEVFAREAVLALVRAADDEQDAAIYLTAAFTGLRRGELVALRWRDVDFAGRAIRVRASYAGAELTTPKSGKVRSVPMAPDVATALAAPGRRARWSVMRTWSSSGSPAGIWTARRYADAIAQRCIVRACGRCASTTCATRSARG